MKLKDVRAGDAGDAGNAVEGRRDRGRVGIDVAQRHPEAVLDSFNKDPDLMLRHLVRFSQLLGDEFLDAWPEVVEKFNQHEGTGFVLTTAVESVALEDKAPGPDEGQGEEEGVDE